MAIALEIIVADIARLPADAIVNAANDRLAQGGGVCGAIFQAAGPELVAACQAIGGCPTGQARITPGFRLPAKWIIHAVGPVWHGGSRGEDAQLSGAYFSCLGLAGHHQVKTLAFPAISTGIYGFPLERATRVAVQTLKVGLVGHRSLEQVHLVCFDADTETVYRQVLGAQTLAI